MIGVCSKCGKKYEIDDKEKLSDFQCSCGGRLGIEIVPLTSKKNKNLSTPKTVEEEIRTIIGGLLGGIKEDKKQEEMRKEEEKQKSKLILCPDCGQKISSEAIECPNCGRPTGREIRREWFLIAIILPPAGFLGGIYFAVKERENGIPLIFLSIGGVIAYFILIFSYLMRGFK